MRALRRGAVTGLVVLLAAALAGCDDGAPGPGPAPGADPAGRAGPVDPADPPGGAPAPPVSFTARVVPGADGIRVSYTLRNDGDRALLVVDGVPRPSGATVVYAPDRTYVTGRGDGTLLAQRAFAWPDADGMAWEVAPRVGVTRLPAGERLDRALSVPTPLVRAHPFGPDLGAGPVVLPEQPAEVTFCLGVIAPPHPPALALDEGGETPTIAHGDAAWEAQHQLCSDPVPFG